MKTVQTLKPYRYWIRQNVAFIDYEEGQTYKVPEAHAEAGVATGHFEVIENAGSETTEMGHEAGEADNSPIAVTPSRADSDATRNREKR